MSSSDRKPSLTAGGEFSPISRLSAGDVMFSDLVRSAIRGEQIWL